MRMRGKRQPSLYPPTLAKSAEEWHRQEQEFLERLYDALIHQSTRGIIRAIPDQPRGPAWQWTIQGTRSHWWLYIQDDRDPELRNRPYYLGPVGDPEFFGLAWHADSQLNLTSPDKLPYFISAIATHMDEKLFGQGEALLAYQAGATPDNPPWIHITEPG